MRIVIFIDRLKFSVFFFYCFFIDILNAEWGSKGKPKGKADKRGKSNETAISRDHDIQCIYI